MPLAVWPKRSAACSDFCQQSGEIATDLAARVPSVANWSLSGLPKYLLPQQVKLVLRKSNRDDPIVQRDRVILLLLARLGLRAAEIVEMTLGDIDWEVGELTIRGKGGRLDKLPLPKDVGRALVHYLKQVRPPCTCRRVFIRSARSPRGSRRLRSRRHSGATCSSTRWN